MPRSWHPGSWDSRSRGARTCSAARRNHPALRSLARSASTSARAKPATRGSGQQHWRRCPARSDDRAAERISAFLRVRTPPRLCLFEMRRFRSPFARLTALCTAFITVWCLGCAAYGSLFSVLGGGMACATRGEMSGMQTSMPGASTVAASNADAPAVSVAAIEAAPETACGCQSCTAATPHVRLASISVSELPTRPVSLPTSHSRSAPEPLLPPPQLAS